MTTGVGGEEAWDDGSGGKDVQLDENDLFEENPPLLEKNLAEDPPSKARNGETANEYPQVRHACSDFILMMSLHMFTFELCA